VWRRRSQLRGGVAAVVATMVTDGGRRAQRRCPLLCPKHCASDRALAPLATLSAALEVTRGELVFVSRLSVVAPEVVSDCVVYARDRLEMLACGGSVGRQACEVGGVEGAPGSRPHPAG
jgi:hypothetical protein